MMKLLKLSALGLMLCASATQAQLGARTGTSSGASSPAAVGTAPATGVTGNTSTTVNGTQLPGVSGTGLPGVNGASPSTSGTTTPLQPSVPPGMSSSANNNLSTNPSPAAVPPTSFSSPATSTATNASTSFNRLDADGDGRLTAAEVGLDASGTEFKLRDANHDGVLNNLEFSAIAR